MNLNFGSNNQTIEHEFRVFVNKYGIYNSIYSLQSFFEKRFPEISICIDNKKISKLSPHVKKQEKTDEKKEDNNNNFFDLCSNGELKKLKTLISNTNIDNIDYEHFLKGLYNACENENADVVEYLKSIYRYKKEDLEKISEQIDPDISDEIFDLLH